MEGLLQNSHHCAQAHCCQLDVEHPGLLANKAFRQTFRRLQCTIQIRSLLACNWLPYNVCISILGSPVAARFRALRQSFSAFMQPMMSWSVIRLLARPGLVPIDVGSASRPSPPAAYRNLKRISCDSLKASDCRPIITSSEWQQILFVPSY